VRVARHAAERAEHLVERVRVLLDLGAERLDRAAPLQRARANRTA